MLDLESTRAMMILRINVLAKGYSGISEKTLRQLIDAFNKDCLSCIPCVLRVSTFTSILFYFLLSPFNRGVRCVLTSSPLVGIIAVGSSLVFIVTFSKER